MSAGLGEIGSVDGKGYAGRVARRRGRGDARGDGGHEVVVEVVGPGCGVVDVDVVVSDACRRSSRRGDCDGGCCNRR